MDKEQNNKQSNNPISKNNVDGKLFALIFAVILVIAIALLVNRLPIKNDEEISIKPLNPSPPGFIIERFDSKSLPVDFVEQTIVMEINAFVTILSERKSCHCVKGLKKALDLYNSGYFEDAFFKFGVVAENILFTYNGTEVEPKVADAIKKAFKQKIITKNEKSFLFKMKGFRNLLAHEPDTDMEKEIVDKYIKGGIIILKKISDATDINRLAA